MTAPVLQVQRWRDNAELIEAVFAMHVWPRWPEPRVLDPTFGRGTWWKDWWHPASVNSPGLLIMDDLPRTSRGYFVKRDKKLDPSFDFRKMDEFDDNSFDVVTFDPDYVAPGGRKTSTIGEFNDRYGLDDEYESPASLQFDTINPGITECARVLDAQGLLLVKATNYISSGKPWAGVYYAWLWATVNCGLKFHDEFVMLTDPGPQPTDRRCSRCGGTGATLDLASNPERCTPCDGTGRIVPDQQHARSNSSTLLVFRKPGRRKKR